MSEEFRLQDPGEGIQEAEIVDLHIQPGQQVSEDDILLDVETDKAVVEVPSPFSGTIDEVKVKQGDIANVGDVLFTFTRQGKAEEKAKVGGQQGTEKPPHVDKEPAHEKGIKKVSPQRPSPASDTPVPAAPSTRRLARELGVSLKEVPPSGPHGRVTSDDVQGYAGQAQAVTSKPEKISVVKQEETKGTVAADMERWGEVEAVPLHGLRRKVAEHMAEAWREIPHVTHQLNVDITELEALRQRHREEIKQAGGHLTLTAFAIKAVVSALKRFPRFNASLDATHENLILKHYYHIGVAVDTEEGLLVPVLHDADRKDIVELSIELDELAKRARTGKLQLDEMRGGSFTLTNPGMLGGNAFTPLINFPEAAILGLAQASLQPIVKGTQEDYTITPRLILPLCLAFDHRINNGADAARFMNAIAEELSDPEQLLLKG